MGKQGKRRSRRGEQDRGITPQALFNFALMMGAYFPCVVAIISLTHTPFCLTLSHSNISSFSLPFCYMFLLSHFYLLLIGILGYSQLSATVTNAYLCPECACECTYLQVQHLHSDVNSCQFPPECAATTSSKIDIKSMYRTTRCLAFFKTLSHYLFLHIFFSTYSTSASVSVCTELLTSCRSGSAVIFYGSSSAGHS